MKNAHDRSIPILSFIEPFSKYVLSSNHTVRLGLVAASVLFLLGQFGRLSIFESEAHIYAYELVLVFTVLVLILRYRLDGMLFVFRRSPLLVFFLVYVIGVLVAGSMSYTLHENGIAVMYLSRMLLYLSLSIYGYVHVKNSPEERTFVSSMLIILLSLIGFISAVQLALFPNLRPLMIYGWDPHLYRMTGTFLEPAFACGVYGVGLFFLVTKKKKSIFEQVLLTILGLLMFLTVSRAGIAALMFSIVTYIFVCYRSWKANMGIIILIVCAVVVLVVVTAGRAGEGMNILRTSTIESRVENYQEAIQIWRQYPIFGVGYNRIAFVKEDFDLPSRTLYDVQNARASFHSSFLIVLVTTGLIGLVLFILLLMQLARVSVFSLFTILFLSTFAVFDNILLHPFILFIFIVALLASINLHPSRTLH
jgi:O-antigen ligase